MFDADEKAERPLVKNPRTVRALFSPIDVIADAVIRQPVAAESQGRPLVVVSVDHELVRDVSRSGARQLLSFVEPGCYGASADVAVAWFMERNIESSLKRRPTEKSYCTSL